MVHLCSNRISCNSNPIKMVSNYSFRYAFSFLLMSLFLSIGITNAQDVELSLSTDAAVIKNGEEIFETNCVSCHDIDKKKVGPALKGVYDRRELSWIIGFVKAPQKTIESGDEQAVALYEEFQSSG